MGSISASHLQGPKFEPELEFLSFWSSCSPCVFFASLSSSYCEKSGRLVDQLQQFSHRYEWMCEWVCAWCPHITSGVTLRFIVTLTETKWLPKKNEWMSKWINYCEKTTVMISNWFTGFVCKQWYAGKYHNLMAIISINSIKCFLQGLVISCIFIYYMYSHKGYDNCKGMLVRLW